MQKNILILALISICFFSLSCEQSNPVNGQGKPTLKASESNVSVTLNYSRTVNISGGIGSYTIKSLSDSSIVTVYVYTQTSTTPTTSGYISIHGNKIGTTKIIIQDSAKTAEVEIFVTVAIITASPSSVTVKTDRITYVLIIGGTPPYKIIQSSNYAIAKIDLPNSLLTVEGISQGTTSVVISDNSNPANVVTIPITVTTAPVLTTSGSISFNSTIGYFMTEGIYKDIYSSKEPSNDAGAGGIVSVYSSNINFGTIIGYKRKSVDVYDVVLITFVKNKLSPGIVSLDSASSANQRDNGSIFFGFNISSNSQTSANYLTYSGDITFSTFTEMTAEGTFQGHAGLFSNQIGGLTPGSNVTISQGSFSVPLLIEDETMTMTQKGDQVIFKQIEKIIRPQVEKIKEQIELQKRHRQ